MALDSRLLNDTAASTPSCAATCVRVCGGSGVRVGVSIAHHSDAAHVLTNTPPSPLSRLPSRVSVSVQTAVAVSRRLSRGQEWLPSSLCFAECERVCIALGEALGDMKRALKCV